MDVIDFEKLKVGSIFKVIDFRNNQIVKGISLIKIMKDDNDPHFPDAYIIKSDHGHKKLGKGYPFYLKDFDKTVLIEE